MIPDRDENTIAVGDTSEVARSSRVLTHPVCPVRGPGNRASKPDRYETVISMSHAVETTCGRQRVAPKPLIQLIGGHAEAEKEHHQTHHSYDFVRRLHWQTTPIHKVIRLNRSVLAVRPEAGNRHGPIAK